MGLPDYMSILRGKLNWLGILSILLWYRRQIDQGRVNVIYALPEYRWKMVPLALIIWDAREEFKKGKPYKR